MEEFMMRIIEMAPAVAVLLFVVIRQERRNELLVNTLVDCFKDCQDQLGDEDDEK